MYAFRYTTYNTLPDLNPGDYPRSKDDVSVTVAATNEADALAAVQAVITRDVYRLTSIAELNPNRALDVEDY